MGDRRRKLSLIVSERERVGRESATVERLEKLGVNDIEVLPDQRQRLIAGPIERMLKAGLIDGREWGAAEEFRRLYYEAEVSGYPRTSNTGEKTSTSNASPVPSIYRSQSVFDARVEWREVERSFKRTGTVWRVLIAAAIDEIDIEGIGRSIFNCYNNREARAAGRAGIKTALAVLADHWRM